MRYGRIKIKKYPNALLNSAGIVMVFIGVAMILPLIVNFIEGAHFLPFFIPICVFLPIGILLVVFTSYPKTQSVSEGVLMLALTWLMTILGGAVPFILFGMSVIDAIFESCSGFTTAGCTIIPDPKAWNYGILLWRSITQWVGGIAIILIFLYVIPTLGFGTRNLFMNEMSGSGSEGLSEKIKKVGKQFVSIYLLFTAVAFGLLMLCGVKMFDAFCLSLSTVSSGGFTNTSDSLISASNAVKIVIMVFMFLGGVNYFLHFKAIYKRKFAYHKSTEFKFIVALNVILIPVIFFIVNETAKVNLLDVAFNVIAATTTAGFAASDYVTWFNGVPIFMLFIASLIGGSSGSTSGGIKAVRFVIVCKYIYNSIRKTLHPNAVYSIKMDKWSVDSRTISLSVLIFILFGITIFVGTISLLCTGLAFDVSLTTTIACLSSFGTGMYEFGPTGCYATMPIAGKIIMCILMWAGRVEILIGLIIFTPGFWREFIISRRAASKNRKASKTSN